MAPLSAGARIGHLHVRVRASGDGEVLPRGRAEAIARDLLPAALAAQIALADERRVVVVRRIRTALVASDEGDPAIALAWGRRIAGAVERTVREADPDEVAVFDDEVAYVASFLLDLSRGVAGERWYYGAFRDLIGLPPAEAARAVLDRDPRVGAGAVARLHSDGHIAELASALGEGGVALAWAALGPVTRSGAADGEALASIALGLARRMGLPTAPVATAGGALASRSAPVDWRNTDSLTEALAAALRDLSTAGAIGPADGGHTELAARAAAACATLDWVDRGRIAEVLAGVATGEPPPRRPAPAAGRADLSADLRAVLDSEPAGGGSAPGRALRLLAALVSRNPRWAGDPEAAAAVERLAARATTTPDAAADAVLGETPHRGGSGEDERDDGARSAFAGILILARAVADIRLPRLASAHGYPAAPDPVTALLAAVGCAWAGPAAVGTGGRLDPAVGALAGTADVIDAGALRASWAGTRPEDHFRAQEVVLETLARIGALPDEAPEIAAATVRDGEPALAVGFRRAGMWVLGAPLDRPQATPHLSGALRAAYERSTGRPLKEGTRDEPAPIPCQSGVLDGAADLSAAIIAGGALAASRRWLRGFESASPAFLVERLIRRPGRIAWDAHEVVVDLAPHPLDVVLHVSGYLEPVEGLSWLGGRRLILAGTHP